MIYISLLDISSVVYITKIAHKIHDSSVMQTKSGAAGLTATAASNTGSSTPTSSPTKAPPVSKVNLKPLLLY